MPTPLPDRRAIDDAGSRSHASCFSRFSIISSWQHDMRALRGSHRRTWCPSRTHRRSVRAHQTNPIHRDAAAARLHPLLSVGAALEPTGELAIALRAVRGVVAQIPHRYQPGPQVDQLDGPGPVALAEACRRPWASATPGFLPGCGHASSGPRSRVAAVALA